MTYSHFGVASALIYTASPMIAFALMVISMVLHSSLTHEALHGHPSQNAFINALLVFPSLSFHVPYLRFKDTHLAHHLDENLTDPFDDPETNFLDQQVWVHLSRSARLLLRINNTLLGRIIIGPIISQRSGAEKQNRENVAPRVDNFVWLKTFCSIKRTVCSVAAASVAKIQGSMSFA